MIKVQNLYPITALIRKNRKQSQSKVIDFADVIRKHKFIIVSAPLFFPQFSFSTLDWL